MRLADVPVTERPRERLSVLGPGALADRELLAMVLGTGGSRGTGAHDLAERLLARFGSISALARARPADLASVAGIGSAKSAAVAAAFELARRAGRAPPAVTVRTSLDVVSVTAPLLRGRDRERLVLVVCDQANRVVSCEVVSEGAADRALLPVREVMVAVLRRDGKAFALAHNHPGGDPAASSADVAATARIEAAAVAVGLRFLDHVVVTDAGWRSIPTGA
jgi:DNA repair protein RadC